MSILNAIQMYGPQFREVAKDMENQGAAAFLQSLAVQLGQVP